MTNISGVHNYCNRWCERCRFQLRCAVYNEISDEAGNLKPISMDEAMEVVGNSFKKTFKLIADWAEKEGIDLNELTKPDPAFERARKKKEQAVDAHPLSKATWEYSFSTKDLLDTMEPVIKEKMETLHKQIKLDIDLEPNGQLALRIKDAYEVLTFYCFPIHVKTKRALSGMLEDDDFQIDPVQNDANGSAKVALLMVEQALASSEVLRSSIPELSDTLLPMMACLQQILNGLEDTFPEARKFIRPGFDDEQ